MARPQLFTVTATNKYGAQGGIVRFVFAMVGLTSPLPVAGQAVAIISQDSEAQCLCDTLTNNAFQCLTFPETGPEGSLESFDVVVNLSDVWTDPDGLLADVMRAGRGVITWGLAPQVLGIDDNPTVQAWIGANMWFSGSDALLTTMTDPILGARPPGTELVNCHDGICHAISDTTGHPNAKVLANFGFVGSSSIGVLRNSWEGGQSVYLSDSAILCFDPGLNLDIFVNAVRALAGPPEPTVPAVSHWGLIVLSLLVLTAGSIVLSRRPRASFGAGAGHAH